MGPRVPQRPRLQLLRQHRLPRPDRRVRGPGHHRPGEAPHLGEGAGAGHQGPGADRGHDPAARGGRREGGRRRDDAVRGHALRLDQLMAKYRFLAYDASGNRVSAMMEAGSPEGVKQLLWADGLFIVNIRATRVTMPRLEDMFPSLIKVRRTELILFSRQLATFIQVGVPMLEGLAVLRDQAASRVMKKALTEIITDITTGASLSHAMSKLPKVFPPLYVPMLRT